jgi:hypothetical protein
MTTSELSWRMIRHPFRGVIVGLLALLGRADAVGAQGTVMPRFDTAAPKSVTDAGFRVVRVPCHPGSPAPGGGTCLPSRFVAIVGKAPKGIGVIRTKAAWNAVKRRFGGDSATAPRDSTIDWSSEMLVLVSYDRGLSEWEEELGFNRAVSRHDTVVVTIGADSIVGTRRGFIDAVAFPLAYAIPRSSLPVRYETLVNDSIVPTVVDWAALARSAP